MSKDKRWTVYADEGDVYLYEHARGARRPLTRTVEAETNPRFTRDGRRVYFTRQNNLYVLSLDGGLLEQLTDIRIGGGGGQSAARGTESQEVLKKEERELLEAVRERAARREEQEAKRKARERRKPYNIAAGQVVSNLTLSPDGAYVVATVQSKRRRQDDDCAELCHGSAYTEDIQSRTKVGDAQGARACL